VNLEAAACGKPALAGNSGGVPDAVEPGVSGWLVDPESDEEILLTLRAALADRKGTEALGRSARARVLTHFRWTQAARVVLETLKADSGFSSTEEVRHVRD
jgi:phosphatidylinositol alpha-1,6-mannosyltransferase